MKYAALAVMLTILTATSVAAAPYAVAPLYDATLGGATADDPTDQGWSALEISLGQNAWATNEAGTLAWVINDKLAAAALNAPAYKLMSIGRVRKRLMYDYGWVHESIVKAKQSVNFITWGCDAHANPWGAIAHRTGGWYGIEGNNQFYVDLENAPKVTLPDDSADSYHTVRVVGDAEANTASLYIDGVLRESAFSIVKASTSHNNNLGFSSGSSSGINRWMHYRKTSLEPVVPGTVLFASELQQLWPESPNTTYQHGTLQPDAALRGSWVLSNGTPQVRTGCASSGGTYPRNYHIGGGSRALRIGDNQRVRAKFTRAAYVDGLVVEFDWQRFGSGTYPVNRGMTVAIEDDAGNDILNFKMRNDGSNQEVRYNVTSYTDCNTGTKMPNDAAGWMATDHIIWYHATVSLFDTYWTLKLERWTDGGTEATTLHSPQTSAQLPYITTGTGCINQVELYQWKTIGWYSNMLVAGDFVPKGSIYRFR